MKRLDVWPRLECYNTNLSTDARSNLACVASISVRFRNKERGTRDKDRANNGASKRAGRGWGRKEGNAISFLPLSLPRLLSFGSRLISRAIKTETPLPRSRFAPKPNGETLAPQASSNSLTFRSEVRRLCHADKPQ